MLRRTCPKLLVARIGSVVSIAVVLLVLGFPRLANAQITFDGTAGPINPPGFGGPNYTIEQGYGTTSGTNLFHSFSEFNVNSGESALFSSDNSPITNIISRVTGGSQSLIDGTVRSSANFWFVNPAGLMINSNATFDVSGSLALGSADYVEFANFERFYALTPPGGEVSTLSIASPTDFGFNHMTSAGSLTMSGFSLNEADWPDLGDVILAGTGVMLDGSVIATDANVDDAGVIRIEGETISILNTEVSSDSFGTLNAGGVFIKGGTITLADGTALFSDTFGTGNAGVILIEGLSILSNVNPDGTPDISLDRVTITSESKNADSGSAGLIDISGGSIALANTDIFASTNSNVVVGNQGAGKLPGEIFISATSGDLSLFASHVSASTSGGIDAGDVSIRGGTITLADGTEVSSDTLGTGNAGVIEIEGETITIGVTDDGTFEDDQRSALINSDSLNRSILVDSGNAGDIFIRGGTITVANALITSTTEGTGDAGLIRVDGGIDLPARSITLSNGTEISSDTLGTGNAGFIDIEGETITIGVTGDGTPEDSRSASINSDSLNHLISVDNGNAGDISIRGGTISLANGAFVSSTTEGTGEAGSIKLDAPLIRSNVNPDGTPEIFSGLQVKIESESVNLDSGSAGLILINGDSIVLSNTQIVASTNSDVVSGTLIVDNLPGEIVISAGTLQLLNGSEILTQATGDSGAGDIDIDVIDDMTISGSPIRLSKISTNAVRSRGGFILLTVESGRLSMRSAVAEASAGADGMGGDVVLEADSVIMQNSAILARAADGDGGAISLTIFGAEQIFIVGAESAVNADSDRGEPGFIDINAPDIDLDSGLQEQDANIVAAPELAANSCSPSATGTMSTFVQDDEGGTPVAPDRYFSANAQINAGQAAAATVPDNSAHAGALLAAVQGTPSESCR